MSKQTVERELKVLQNTTEGESYMMFTPMPPQCRKSSGREEMASRY
jgi:hypothetical protein